MADRWLTAEEMRAWLRLVAVTELLPSALDTQLRRDAGLTHFDYFVLSRLSEAPERTLRMTALAQGTNATLPRLSHVVRRLGGAGSRRTLPLPRGPPGHECPPDAVRVGGRRGCGSRPPADRP